MTAPRHLALPHLSGRRRGKRRFWLTELRSVLDRAEALRFPTHRKDHRS